MPPQSPSIAPSDGTPPASTPTSAAPPTFDLDHADAPPPAPFFSSGNIGATRNPFGVSIGGGTATPATTGGITAHSLSSSFGHQPTQHQQQQRRRATSDASDFPFGAQEGREPPSFSNATAIDFGAGTSASTPLEQRHDIAATGAAGIAAGGGGGGSGIFSSAATESLPDFLRFGGAPAPAATAHSHHSFAATPNTPAGLPGAAYLPGAASTVASSTASGIRHAVAGGGRGLAVVNVTDAATETAQLLSIDDEISLAARQLRDLDTQLAASRDSALNIEAKALLADDELRARELAAQRAIDAANIELDRAKSTGSEYSNRKVRQLNDDKIVEGRKIHDELKAFHDQRRARHKQQQGEERARIQKEVAELTAKRDVLEEENGGANETRAIRKIQKAKTAAEKIAVAADIAASLAQQLKTYVSENVRDLVRGETITAFDQIRRSTLDQRQSEKMQRTAGMTQFQRDAVQRSQELLRARDEARRRRMVEHQQLLERARNRATKATTESTQALLDEVTSTHNDAMRKFKIEFDSQHEHVKQMHALVVKDDKQLDAQRHREAQQRFQSHRKMAKELLDADAQALGHAKQREATMWSETTAEADPNAAPAIAQSIVSSVMRGTADVQRRLSTVASSVRAQVASMERQASVRKVASAAAAAVASGGASNRAGAGLSGNVDTLEATAAVGEIKKMLAAAMERRVDNHKKLEQGVSQFVAVVEKCGSVAQVQRNEVKTTSSHAMSTQAQWEGELRRMMADFSIIAAATSSSHRRNSKDAMATQNPAESPTTTASTPVGFLLSTINDCVERLSAQLRAVGAKVIAPVDAQRLLLSSASKEDKERLAAHGAVDAKVMRIFHMFEAADAAMDSVRQREDEVRIEEISLAAQQRQLAEERRAFSVKCEAMKRAVEQTERESGVAQAREREARRELADSERQLSALAIEQRTLVARAVSDTAAAGVSGSATAGHTMTAVRASTFIDPLSGMMSGASASSASPSSSRQPAAETATAAGLQQQSSINPMYRGLFADRTNGNVHSAGGAGAASKMMMMASAAAKQSGANNNNNHNSRKFGDGLAAAVAGRRTVAVEQAATTTHGATTTTAQESPDDEDIESSGVSSGEALRRMKARFNTSAAANRSTTVGAGAASSLSAAGSPGGHQADVSGGGNSSSDVSRFSGIYGAPPVRGAGMSAMAAAVSPPATASSMTTSSRR